MEFVTHSVTYSIDVGRDPGPEAFDSFTSQKTLRTATAATRPNRCNSAQ
jgi:hypothetical protein